jgi:FtsP/CotA-like multicopper oxidase with cupredoxin domain
LRPRAAVAALLLALPLAGPPARSPGDTSTRAPERIVANPNRTPARRLRGGMLSIELQLRTGLFHPQADDGPAIEVQAFGEPGRSFQIPGPLIRVPEGTVIAATIRNTLRDSTLVLYGLHLRPGRLDDTIQVAPGASRKVRFAAGRAGTYFYWGTTTGKKMDDDRWIDSQLSGALIVDPAGTLPPAEGAGVRDRALAQAGRFGRA